MSETTPAPEAVVGQPVPISLFDGTHTVYHTIAHVLAIGLTDPEIDLPEISVAYPALPVNPKVLASSKWADGYVRRVGVKHVSHPDVMGGRVSICYGGTVDTTDAAVIPQPESDPTNPIFTRQDDPEAVRVSLGQAAVVQMGQTSAEGGSPLLGPTEGIESPGSGSERWGATDWTQSKQDHDGWPTGEPISHVPTPAEVPSTEQPAGQAPVLGTVEAPVVIHEATEAVTEPVTGAVVTEPVVTPESA
jgi:hypothetical protein